MNSACCSAVGRLAGRGDGAGSGVATIGGGSGAGSNGAGRAGVAAGGAAGRAAGGAGSFSPVAGSIPQLRIIACLRSSLACMARKVDSCKAASCSGVW